MKTVICDLAHRPYIPVSEAALKSEKIRQNVRMSCDCDGDCGSGDCDCAGGDCGDSDCGGDCGGGGDGD